MIYGSAVLCPVAQLGQQVACAGVVSQKNGAKKPVNDVASFAVNRLQQMFANLVFDLRNNNFQEFYSSFGETKDLVEKLLNDSRLDREGLTAAFNSVASRYSLTSKDCHKFDVRATMTRFERIELTFIPAEI